MNLWWFVIAAAVLLVVFVGLWWLDSRRAERVRHDPERVEGDIPLERRRRHPRR